MHGTGKKLSKMAGNSASKPLNCTPNELPCTTVEWWRIAWKKLYAFSRYTAFNISNRFLQSHIHVWCHMKPYTCTVLLKKLLCKINYRHQTYIISININYRHAIMYVSIIVICINLLYLFFKPFFIDETM